MVVDRSFFTCQKYRPWNSEFVKKKTENKMKSIVIAVVLLFALGINAQTTCVPQPANQIAPEVF